MTEGKKGSSGMPKDWKPTTLGEIARVERGKFSARPRNDPKYYGGAIPFVQTGDITSSNGRIEKFVQTLNEDGLLVSKLFPKDTILVTIAANIGDVAMTTFPVACPDSLVAVRANDGVSNTWLFHFLQTQKAELDSSSTQNAQKNINLQVLNPLKVLLPPLEEQRKIADILSTWDEAIEQQTRLLERKRERKRGLMQQLLTGKVRFKEFEGLEWKTYTFNELAKQRGRKFDPQDVGEARRCIELEHIEQGTGQLLGWVDSSQQASTKNVFQVGDVLFGKLRPYLRKFWHAQFDGVCTTEAWVLVPSKLLDTSFLFYLVQSQEFMAAANVSSGSKMPRAEWKHLAEVPFTVPPFQEQQKIAAVLSAADAELETLETQLSALRTQKRGLMQQLLTGKTRVKVDAAPAEAAVLP